MQMRASHSAVYFFFFSQLCIFFFFYSLHFPCEVPLHDQARWPKPVSGDSACSQLSRKVQMKKQFICDSSKLFEQWDVDGEW